MSHSARTIDDLLALERSCETCGAGKGQWCVVRENYPTAGTPATFLHVGRSWATRHAHWVGYTRGQVDQLRAVLHELEHPSDPTILTPGGRAWIRRLVVERLEKADRWAQSAHQAALADIPNSWQR